MKTILIATDFSVTAKNAMQYGAGLAKSLNAKIILFSSYINAIPDFYLPVTLSPGEIETMYTERLHADASLIRSEVKIPVEVICKEGVPYREIIDTAEAQDADYIVAGMKGHGKNFRKIFGSTALSLAESSSIPVIIVPEGITFTPPQSIALASDIRLSTDVHTIEPLLNLIDIFHSKLHVVRVVKADRDAWYEVIETPRRLRSVVASVNAEFDYPEDKNVRHALDTFIDAHSIKMLAMMPHKKDWLEKIFTKSETKDMLFHTHVPVLILPEIPGEG